MAKAKTRNTPPKRVQVTPQTGAATDRVGYLKGVWDELKKVIWPAPQELWRMTGIVIATVIIFSALIGGADYGLSLVVKQLYTQSASSNNTVKNTTNPGGNVTPTFAPQTSSQARPSPPFNLPSGVPQPPGN